MIFIHKRAEVHKTARIGDHSRVWNNAQIREYANLGKACIVGTGVYIDHHVILGANCRIQNYASIYYQTTIEANVFIGPYACIVNDKSPRAAFPNGQSKKSSDWQPGHTAIRTGASIGAGSIILPNLTVGRWAMVGAGSVVLKDVPDYGLVYGVPAILHGYVCRCGGRLKKIRNNLYGCTLCGEHISIK